TFLVDSRTQLITPPQQHLSQPLTRNIVCTMSYEQDITKLKERAITLADDKNGWSVSSKSK
ncbi:hypothetical protein BgiBS90_006624, partial [Biomphalaria glabrata]